MKLYWITDGPPSLAVRLTLKALDIPCELHLVDYIKGEHMTADYAKMNPQKEIPVLDDDGFYVSESVAIIQYLCDKYRPDSPLYPKDPKQRAMVNQRLIFNSGFYYTPIMMYTLAPIFFDYARTERGKTRVELSLSTLETYLKQTGKTYVIGDTMTVADFPLISSTMTLEGTGWDLSEWPLVKKWYESFKVNNPDLWSIVETGLDMVKALEKNPPMIQMIHHIHPIKKLIN